MNFDLDDPLGDILSDGSNDSFFETTKKPTPKARTQKPSTPIKDSNKKIADLFGIKSEEPKFPTTSKPNPFETQQIPKEIPKSAAPTSVAAFKPKEETRKAESPLKQPPPPPKATVSTKRDTSFDDDNDDIDLGFDLKKIKSKSGILDDILNIDSSSTSAMKTQSRPKTTPNPPAPPVSRKENIPSKSTTLTDQADRSDLGPYAPSIGRPRTGRRSSTTLPDPLGLFASDEPTTKKPEAKKVVKSTTDWLGLDSKKDKDGESLQQQQHQQLQQNEAPTSISITKTDMPQFQSTQMAAPAIVQPISLPNIGNMLQLKSDPIHAAQILSLSNRETETAMQELRQQELQVIYATQVRNQEHVLYDMQKR